MKRPIRTRIIISSSIIIILMMAIFTYISISYSSAILKKNAAIYVETLLDKHAKEIENELSRYIHISQILKTQLEKPVYSDRKKLSEMFVHMIENDSHIMGIYANYESQQFDNKDYFYKNNSGSDSTGRFLPYWNRLREKGKITLETAKYPDTSAWYLIPQKTGEMFTIDPYEYEGLTLISFIQPIMKKNRFIGITGVDAVPEVFDKNISALKIFENGYGFLLGKNLKFISFREKENLGQITLQEWGNKISSSQVLSLYSEIESKSRGKTTYFDPLTNKKSEVYFLKIEPVGWTLVLVVPEEEMYAEVNSLYTIFLVTGVLLLVILNLIIIYIVRRNIIPIEKLTLQTKKLSDGIKRLVPDNNKIVELKKKDEIEVLASAFNYLFESIVESYNELDSFINSSPDAIVIINDRLKILRVNESFTKLYGWHTEEVAGREMMIIPEYEIQFAFERYRRILIGEIIYPFTAARLKKDGTTVTVNITLSPVRDSKNKIIAVASIMRDVSESEQIKKDLIRAKEEAEKADRLKTEFLAQVSHEIRTPINTMLNFAGLLEMEIGDDINEDIEMSFEMMGRAGTRIIRTIDLILHMAELQTNSYHYYKEEFYLFKDILDILYSEFIFLTKRKGLEFEKEYLCEDVFIFKDKNSIYQIFSHIIDNAVKYTSRGKIKIVAGQLSQDQIFVEIIDTGIGISETYQKYLFTPFSQEEQGYTRKFEGNGLGLAIVKKYCDLNSATIQVESSKGKGTAFKIIFNL